MYPRPIGMPRWLAGLVLMVLVALSTYDVTLITHGKPFLRPFQ